MSNRENSADGLIQRYEVAVVLAERWLKEHNRSQSWLANELQVEKSVLSRFLQGEHQYLPTPSRKKIMAILEGIERVCRDDSRHIFLSHRSSDKEFVRKLAADLEATPYGDGNIRVWLDEAEIRPGESIPAMVSRGIESSAFIAIVMTPNYFKEGSGWTDAEWHAAIHSDPDNRQARLIPLLAEDCPKVPALLRHLLMIDFRGKKYKEALEQLVRAIRNEPLPRPVAFRGQLIESNGSIRRETLIAERAVPEADPDVVSERLYCNLLPVDRVPKYVYYAPIASSLIKRAKGKIPSKAFLKDRITDWLVERGEVPWMPAFRQDGEGILTFHDLDEEGPFDAIITRNGIERFSTAEFLQDADDRRLIVSLVNMAISRHLFRCGLMSDNIRHQRFFFPVDDGEEIKIDWVPKTKRATRTVAKKYVRNEKQDGWMHHACYFETLFLASRLYVKLSPTRVLTDDGKTVRRGLGVGKVVVRWLAQERNLHVLYNVRFWTSVLQRRGRRGGPIIIDAGDQIIELAKIPAATHLAYGIRGDQRDLMGDLDREAEMISQQENEPDDVDDDDIGDDDELEFEHDGDSYEYEEE